MLSVRHWMLATTLVVAGCTGAPSEAPAPTEQANPETPDLGSEKLKTEAENVTLVPSPVETSKALARAGIETTLSDLVVHRELDVANENPDNAAVRTGVVIADMLLTVKTSSKEQLRSQIKQVIKGMEQLGGGKDILATLTDIDERVAGDSVTRDELLKELDEIAGAVIPELEFNGQDRIVPLIQAGSWLEGANLLAKAVKTAEKPAAADGLLKQPAVVGYFKDYVSTEGQEIAPESVTEKLSSALDTLLGIAEKQESLTMADIDTVIKTTDDVLALL